MKILVVGFFGEKNLGDEAIFSGISSSLSKQSEIMVTSGTPETPNSVPRKGFLSWPYFVRTLLTVDRVIFSGGILQDWSAEGVLFFALRILAAKAAKKRPSLWGAGLGPLRRGWAKSLSRKALRHTSEAWLRDKKSRELFQSFTGNPGNLGTDWSWGISKSNIWDPVQTNAFGINLRPWKFFNWADETVQRVSSQKEPVIGISARPEDASILRTRIPSIKISAPLNFGDLLSVCSTLREGWAMRYHVLLAMLRAEIPVISIPYDEKVFNLSEEARIACFQPDVGTFTPSENPGWRFLSADLPRIPHSSFKTQCYSRFHEMRTAFLKYCGEK